MPRPLRPGATLHICTGTSDGNHAESEMAELGRTAASALLKNQRQPRTDLVGVNDRVALGLLAGLRWAGISVPKAVSVVGIDGVFLDKYVSPALTMVGQPMQALATAAVDNVLARLKEPGLPPQSSIFPPTLIVRDSTGPVENWRLGQSAAKTSACVGMGATAPKPCTDKAAA